MNLEGNFMRGKYARREKAGCWIFAVGYCLATYVANYFAIPDYSQRFDDDSPGTRFGLWLLSPITFPLLTFPAYVFEWLGELFDAGGKAMF